MLHETHPNRFGALVIVDVRIVVARDGTLRVSVEGRRVALPTTPRTTSAALAELAKLLEGVAWSTRRDELDEIADPASKLFEVRS